MTGRDEAMARRAQAQEAFHLEGRGGGSVGGGASGIPRKFDTRLHPHGRGGKFAQTFTVKLKKHSETGTTRTDAVHVNGQHVGYVHHTVEKAASSGYSNRHTYHYVHGTSAHAATPSTVGKVLPVGGSKASQQQVATAVSEHVEKAHPDLGVKSGGQAAPTKKLTGDLKPGDVVKMSKGVHRTVKSVTPVSKTSSRVAYHEPADAHWGAANTASHKSEWNVVPKISGVTVPGSGADKHTGMPDPAKPVLADEVRKAARGNQKDGPKDLGQQQIAGATAIVNGKAGRWVKLNGVQSHIPHHEEYSRTVGGDTFTSPKGTTAVLKNGVMHSAPRGQKGDVSLIAKTATTAPSAPSLHGGPTAKVPGVSGPQALSTATLKSRIPKLADGSYKQSVSAEIEKRAGAQSVAEDRAAARKIIAKKYAKPVTLKPEHTVAAFHGQDLLHQAHAAAPRTGPLATAYSGGRNIGVRARPSQKAGMTKVTFDGKPAGGSEVQLHITVPHSTPITALRAATAHFGDLMDSGQPTEGQQEHFESQHTIAGPSKVTPQIPTSHPLTVALHGELAKQGTSFDPPKPSVGKVGQLHTFPDGTRVAVGNGVHTITGRDDNFNTHTVDEAGVGHSHAPSVTGRVVGPKPAPATSHSMHAHGEHTIAHYADGSSKVLSAQGKASSLAATYKAGEVLKPELNSPGRSSAGRMRNFHAMSDAKLTGVLTQLTHHHHPVHGQDHEALASAQAEAIARTMKHHMQEAEFSDDARKKLAKKGVAMPDGSFPIRNGADLANAVHAVGRAKDPGSAKAHIIKRAKALKATGALPDGWLSEADVDAEVEEAMIAEAADSLAKASTPEPFSTSKTSNWVARGGGLPDYIQHVAHGLVRAGKPTSEAISMAIGIVKRWARGGGNVDAGTKAAAAKAVAEWEDLKARNKAKRTAKAAS